MVDKLLNERLLIVGASARPWLQSARLAGFEVAAFDFFADWDARASLSMVRDPSTEDTESPKGSIGQISRFENLFDRSNDAVIRSCNAAVICGGFESRIELVEALAARITLLGTEPAQLRRLRDTPAVFDFLRQKRVAIPETKLKLASRDEPECWLKKTRGTSGGQGVHVVCSTDIVTAGPEEYFQAKIAGRSVVGVFVSHRRPGRQIETLLFGVTEQIIGDELLGAAAYQYCGSIGPLGIPNRISDQIESVGRCLAIEFEITGMWGIDFIVSENGAIPVDINPRMTASMELFEWTFRQVESGIRSTIDLHVKACRGQLERREIEKAKQAIADIDATVEGKAILFHRGQQPLPISTAAIADLKQFFEFAFYDSTECGSSIADIPHKEQLIKPGHPILTLRIRTQSDQVLSRLHAQAAEIFEALQVVTE